MPLAVGDGQKGRQCPRVVIEAVHLYGAFGLPELCPGKHRQAQINGGRIDRIGGVSEPEPVLRGQIPAPCQKMIEHILKNPIVSFCIHIREGASAHPFEPQMIPAT